MAKDKTISEILKAAKGRISGFEEEEARKKGIQEWIRFRKSKIEEEQELETKAAEERIKETQKYYGKLEELSEIHQREMVKHEQWATEKKEEARKKDFESTSDYLGRMLKLYAQFESTRAKHSAKLLVFMKAVAMAKIIIDKHTAIMDALAKGGIMGKIEAALITAEAAAAMAAVSAQSTPSGVAMAGGGMVPGISPGTTSDDKWVRATSGEYFHPVDSVRYYGAGVMEGIRQKTIPREVFAGFTPPSTPSPSQYGFQAGGMVAGGAQGSLTIMNIVDPREIDKRMNSAAGKKAYMNFISSERQTIRRLLR